MPDLSGRFERDNKWALGALVKQLRAPMGGVIPFVGAGMSREFCFPTWEQFLREEAEDWPEILTDVDAGNYLKAAQGLRERLGADRFHRVIDERFGDEPDSRKLTDGPLSVLASMVTGPVITTNFDHVLERVFAAAGNAFQDEVWGAQLDTIVNAIHTGRHVLLKIHGDASERTSRTFTLHEYLRSYATGEITVPDLALLMFGNRPLLFLGCSLASSDPTVEVLEDVHERLIGVRHFAIVSADPSDPRATSRRDALDACGISPIWFPPRRFDLIEEHLWTLREHAASRDLQPSSVPGVEPPSPRASVEAFVNLANDADSRIVRMDSAVVRPIARAALEGRLTFVLGADTHRSQLAKALAGRFDVSETISADNLRTILADRGVDVVFNAVREFVASRSNEASIACRLVAALPGFLRGTGVRDAAAQLVFSTDYGTMLEESFEAAAEPFHLLYLMTSGHDEGRFLHRLPDGAIRVIERPDLIGAFRPRASVIVKVRGGVLYRGDSQGQVLESISIEDGDIARAAVMMMRALPRAIHLGSRKQSLLLLGYGLLDDPDVDMLVRTRGGTSPAESWAFYGVEDYHLRNRGYWAKRGVHMHGGSPDAAVLSLHAGLLSEAGSSVVGGGS